jgi:hypothetical protein
MTFEETAMKVMCRAGMLFLCFLLVSLPVLAQQPDSPALVPRQAQSSDSRKPYLVMDVVVTDKAGKVTKGLEQKDFTVQDGGQSQKIVAFRAVGGEVVDAQPNDPPVKVIFMVDEINTTFSKVAYERNQITKFLQQNGGKISHPVSMGFFSDDITDQLNRCLADADAYYTLAMDTAPADHPDLYHAVEVKVAPGFIARTRDGYYVQP